MTDVVVVAPTANQVVVTAPGAMTVVTVGVQGPQGPSGGAGGVPTGTGFRHVVSGAEDAAAKLVVDADVDPAAAIAETKLNLATDAAAGTGSRRTLGAGAQQACAGNDSRLSNARTPTAHASTHLPNASDTLDWTGTIHAAGTHAARPAAAAANAGTLYFETDTVRLFRSDGATWLQVAIAGLITDTDVAAANKDGASGTASMRTLGAGAAQSCAGNDARLADARTPTAHATSHKHGGSDEVATATPGANVIPKAGAGSKLDKGFVPDFVASGASHASGGVPDPGASAGTTKFLREDAIFAVPAAAVTAPDVQVFTATGGNTWTKPGGSPLSVLVILIGAGGGGGSGARRAAGTIRNGGAGGGGGGYAFMRLKASDLGPTETVTVGAGGTGGPAITVDTTVGTAGNAGADTTFGAHAAARGGVGGSGGGSATPSTGGNGGGGGALGGVGGQGNAAANSEIGWPSGYWITPGNGTAPVTIGSGPGGAGGGGGGGISAGDVRRSGGAGGGAQTADATALSGGAGGAGGGTNNGAAPTDRGTTYLDWWGGAAGGGGGAGSAAGAAGAGAVGGKHGGGGGGGGGSDNGFNSGAGGNGAQGIAVVVTYFA